MDYLACMAHAGRNYTKNYAIGGMSWLSLRNSTRIVFFAGASCFPAVTVFAASPEIHSFQIRNAPLSDALLTIAKQAGTQVSFSGAIVAGKQTPAFSGEMSTQAAITRALIGTNLAFITSTDGKIITIQRKADGAIRLSAIRVRGEGIHESPTGPGVGYVAENTVSATKTDTPITEIPNSIYVVTKQQLIDQQPQSIQDALKYTAGVFSGTEGTGSTGANTRQQRAIMQRGFTSTQFVDGLLTNTQSAGEPAFLERIEAVNGPASVMYGKLTPGGMIAETLKKPTDTPLHQVSVGFGNWGRYEATLDISDKITKSGNLRYRIAAIGVTQGTQTDHVNYHRVGVLPSITWDIDKNTSLTLLGSYMYTPGDGSSPGNYYPLHGTLITDGYKQISRHSYLGIPNWNTQGEKDGMFEYQFQHKFNKYINLNQTFRYENSEYDAKNVYYNGEGSAGEVYVQPNLWKQTYETVTFDTRLSGKFKTGQVNHTWVVGTDFQDYHYSLPWKIDYTPGDSGVAVNIYNPNPSYTPCYSSAPSAGCVGSDSSARFDYFQEGVYFQDQIKWRRLSILLGGRQDWVNYKGHTSETDFSNSGNTSTTTSSTNKTSPQPQSAFTWRAGVIYNFDFGLTPYFSYATSFVPQMSTDYRGQPFAPLSGKQFEAGLKYKVPNRDILLTAAAFHIDEDNYLITDPVHTSFSTNAGRVRSQGFEVSANANITANLRAIASYSYVDMRYANTNKSAKRYNPYTELKYGNAISEQGMSVPYVPRNMFSVFLDYSFPGNLMKGFGVNGGMRYVGFTYIDSVESFKTPAYFLFDIGAHYDFGKMIPSLRGLKAQLAVSNLTNKYYVTSCSTSNCFIGQGRRVYGNLTYNW